jgi:hypothetical protein
VDGNGLLNILFQFDTSADIGFHRGIIRFNAEKEIVSVWEAPFQHTTTIVENMVLLRNGNFVIMEQDNPFTYQLMFLSYNGDHIVTKELPTNQFEQKVVIELRVARNGDIIGCGVYQSTQTDTFGCCIYTGYIFRMSQDGELLWERIIIDYDSTGRYKDGTFTDIHELPNGDLILGGDIEALHLPQHDSDMWLVRTDSMGCLKPGCGEIQVVTGTKEVTGVGNFSALFKLYPNPVTDQISFSIPEELLQRATQFEIRDIYGQLRMQGSIDPFSLAADVSGLMSGVYTITFLSRGKILAIEKFVKITTN